MPLPTSLTTVPVTAKYVHSDGTPVQGSVTFTTDQVLAVDGVIIAPKAIQVELNELGELSTELPATNDPDLNVTGWTWIVSEFGTGGPSSRSGRPMRSPWALEVPHDAASIDLGTVMPSAPVTSVTPYAGTAVENVFTKSQTLRSSFAGGEDDGSPESFDSTTRLNLESYQRASSGSFGETVRHFLRRKDAKAMVAYYFPEGGYDPVTREPIGDFVPVVWHGAHWEDNSQTINHKHWSVETPDPTGAIQTRFEIRFGDQDVDDAIAGLDKTNILTNLADLTVRATNGQVLRISSNDTHHKDVEFSTDHEGADEFRLWRLRAAAGNGDFQLIRYGTSGEFLGDAITVKRSSGRVGINTNDPSTSLDVNADQIRVRQPKTPATSTAPGTQGSVTWDDNYMYVCVATNTWKRTALESW